MRKKIAIFPLLFVSPLLFMANSPAPAAFPLESYHDFIVTNFVQSDEKNEEEKYEFSITIKNFGDNYLLFNAPNFAVVDKNNTYGYIDSISRTDTALNPGTTRTFSGTSSKKLIVDDDLEFHSAVYSSPYLGKYKSVTFKEKSEMSDGTFRYWFSVDKLEVDDEFYHSYIIDYSYLGEKRAFDQQSYLNDFYITLEEDLDGQDIEINKVLVANGRSKRASSISSMWLIIWIVIGIFASMGLIAAAIVLPIVIPMAVRKKKAESQKNS